MLLHGFFFNYYSFIFAYYSLRKILFKCMKILMANKNQLKNVTFKLTLKDLLYYEQDMSMN